MSTCIIADVFLDILQTGQAGILRAGYLDVPVGRLGGGYIDSDPHDFPIAADGTFSLAPLWGSQTDPTTARIYLQFPDGNAWGGVVPSVSGPLTIEQLKTSYGWGVVSASSIPVVTVTGPTGATGPAGAAASGVLITSYGAAQDGSDTMLAITAAQAALPATGGKITLPAGTWTIWPTTTHEVVLRPGVTLEGEGAATVLKVKDNQGDWRRLFTSSTGDNITLRDFKIDYNIAANVSSTVATGGSATQNAVEILGGKNIRLDSLTFDTAGVNTVTINGATVDDVTVENCRFNFAQRTGNADYDNTCLYIHGKSYSIHKNHFTASITPGTGAKTAFEAHGGPSSVQGNTGYGFRDAGHLVATTESRGGISCVGNDFSLVANGIDIWTSSYGARLIVVTDNTMDLAQVTHNQASTRGIAIMADTSNTSDAQVIILGRNAVSHQLEDGTRTTAWSNNTANQSLVGSETYGIGVHNLGGAACVILSDNAVDLAPGRGMVLGSQSGTGTFSNVAITDNILTNPGQNTALGTGYRTGIELGNAGVTLRDVVVKNNQISDTFATTRLQKYFDTDAGGTYVRVEVHSNKLSSANAVISSSLAVSGISTTVPIGDLPTGTSSTTLALGNDSRITGAIQSSLVTGAGDLIYATANAVLARLAAGTSSQVLIGGSTPAFGAVPLAALSGITTSQLSASAGLLAGQITSVNPSALTGTGTVPIGGIPTGSSSSTVTIGNDSRLSDARTPTAHRTTHLPSGSDDLYLFGGHSPNPSATTPSARIEVFPDLWVSGVLTLATQFLFLSEFTAPASITVKTLGTWVSTALVVGAGSCTHAQFSLYSVNAGVYTLLAASTDDTSGTFLQTAGLASKTIADTAITLGTRYAVGISAVFTGVTTSPSLPTCAANVSSGFTSKAGFPTKSMQASGVTTTVTGPYTGAASTRCFWFYLGN